MKLWNNLIHRFLPTSLFLVLKGISDDIDMYLCSDEEGDLTVSTQKPPCAGARFYQVRPGDTYYLIARDLGVTVEEIARLNPNVNPENLQVGSFICVPLQAGIPTGRVPPCDSGLYWVIAPGDTMFTIAQAVGVPLERLLALNPSVDPNNLLPGDSICLPAR